MSVNEVVCKFVFSAMKTELDYKKRKIYTLEFHPVAGDSEENKKFWEATPSGTFNFQTINAEAAKMFMFGHEYYVTFREAPQPSQKNMVNETTIGTGPKKS